jgi:hypothetical protein
MATDIPSFYCSSRWGSETANVHLETEGRRKAILKDLRSRKPGWLAKAAQALTVAVARDWRTGKENRRG